MHSERLHHYVTKKEKKSVTMSFISFLQTTRTVLAPYREYYLAILILIGSYFGARLLYYILDTKLKNDARHHRNSFEDQLLKQSELPLFLGVFLLGLFIVTRNVLSILYPYRIGINKFFLIFAIIWGVYYGLKVLNTSLKWYAWKHKRWNNSLFIVRKLITIVIYLIAFLLILGELGFAITPLVASLGIGGLAVALALQPTLTNYFAGLYIASDETVRPGDYVEVNKEIKGSVESINWRSTKIRTYQGNTIIVPNSKLADSIVTNYSEPRDELSISVPFGVRYGSNLEKIEKITVAVAKEVLRKDPAGVSDVNPIVRFREFGSSSINLVVILRAHSYGDGFALRHHFMKALVARYAREGMSAVFPTVTGAAQNLLLTDARKKSKGKKKAK